MSSCPVVDANVSQWGACATETIFANDPVIFGGFILLLFVIVIVTSKLNAGIGAMVSFGIAATLYMANPTPFWGTIAALIVIASVFMLWKGVNQNVGQ